MSQNRKRYILHSEKLPLWANIWLRCVSDGSVQPPYSLSCPHDNSLLRADYQARQTGAERACPASGASWTGFPCRESYPKRTARSVTYKSRGLAGELGLENLYISFNGYWPERGARMPTCSFKDLEAAPTMQRLQERGDSSHAGGGLSRQHRPRLCPGGLADRPASGPFRAGKSPGQNVDNRACQAGHV